MPRRAGEGKWVPSTVVLAMTSRRSDQTQAFYPQMYPRVPSNSPGAIRSYGEAHMQEASME
jgi:hypothetical protein